MEDNLGKKVREGKVAPQRMRPPAIGQCLGYFEFKSAVDGVLQRIRPLANLQPPRAPRTKSPFFSFSLFPSPSVPPRRHWDCTQINNYL